MSQDNPLGVTMVAPDNATKPDPNGDGGADVQFDMGKGDITFSALGQDFEIKKFQARPCTARRSCCARKSAIKECGSKKPLCSCPKRRWSWHKWRWAADHTRYGVDADLFIEQPQPFSGDFNKPDDDKLMLHNSSQSQVTAPPIFLKKVIADLIRDNWK